MVWVRRALNGTEVSGHLLYAHDNGGSVVFLDGMTGGRHAWTRRGCWSWSSPGCGPPAGRPVATGCG
ncbi:hypothetical protein [Streptomyces vinaceus]|uniref:hypothetical protein n=1 Tax=Streptomyces vinaceus TaxID=1960 RepID=UPI0036A3917B